MIIQTFFGSFKPAVEVSGITATPATLALETGESGAFTVAVSPTDATNKRYTVESSNPDLVTVARTSGDNWTATAAANPEQGGIATITVTSKADPSKTATITVTVRVPVTAITVDKPTVQGDTKTSVDVTFTVQPDNATDKTLTVTSSAPTIASVKQKSGLTYTISYLKGGACTITATSKSDPDVTATVAVTAIQTGPSDEEKAAWRAARQKEVDAGTYKGKIPTADYEPLEGWTPFADYGTDPAEIISNAMKANDTSALLVGDYFDITVSGNKLRYEITAFDQYLGGGNSAHHALMVPTTPWPTSMAFDAGSDNTYKTSDLHNWEENTFYKNLPAKTKAAVLQVNIPWYNSSGQAAAALAGLMRQAGIVEDSSTTPSTFSWTPEAEASADRDLDVTAEEKYDELVRAAAAGTYADVKAGGVACRVFSLGEIELFGAKTYSTEAVVNPGGSGIPNHKIAKFKNDASRVRKNGASGVYWWERSAYSGGTIIACCVAPAGSADSGNVNGTGAFAVPCFCLG